MPVKNISFIASIDDDHMEEIDAIAKKLKKMGFLIKGVMPSAGVISASGEASLIDKIVIPGIDNIETERIIKAK